MNSIKKTALGLLVAILAIGFSAFTSPKASNMVTYHIVSETPEAWTVTTEGSCTPGDDPCSFDTNLSPDGNQFLKETLENANVEIVPGDYQP